MCAGGVTTVPPNSAVACGTPSLSAYHHVVFCADSADETDRGPVPAPVPGPVPVTGRSVLHLRTGTGAGAGASTGRYIP